MKKWIVSLGLISIVLAGCGNNGDDSNNNEEVPVFVEASLDVPESAELGEEVSFTVTVMQGSEPVDDADEVVFEIWQGEDREQSEEIEAVSEGDGKYTVQKAFAEDGVYSVQSHVTARDLHTMPKKTITVGNAADADQTEQEEDNS
ncbi:FixH family protein [Cytobacillus gottheilii]|uniref:FixH family protein n=1 Tax=Cytobacillus gottheilii TaxID=859144 RepID=UPI00082FC42D|nr:FixH family protein [Cytobacillus gottheilii]